MPFRNSAPWKFRRWLHAGAVFAENPLRRDGVNDQKRSRNPISLRCAIFRVDVSTVSLITFPPFFGGTGYGCAVVGNNFDEYFI